MKKMIIGVIACMFIAGPALAEDFAAMKASKLKAIEDNMEIFKTNPANVAFLTEKKACVEKAADADALKGCIENFSQEKLEAISH